MRNLLSSMSVSGRVLLIGAMGFSQVLGTGQLSAATKAERLRASEELVEEALHREIYGLDAERNQLLDKALSETPEYAPAMWHRGYVRHQNKWVKADELPQLAAKDPRVTTYRRIRSDYPLTVDGQLQLANWCQKKGLVDCERAHLMNVLNINANHAEARQRLGFRRIDGEWVTSGELADAARQLDETRESLAKWQADFDKLIKMLNQSGELKHRAARDQVLAIDDATAIPSLELQLAPVSEEAGLLAVDALHSLNTNEASHSLARLALFSTWPAVREAAATKLQSRNIDTFVPDLLSNMYTPLVAQMRIMPGQGGRLLYRHSFMREGQNERELLVLDTTFRRVARLGGDGRETLSRMVAEASDAALRRRVSVAQQNQRTAELNSRAAAALNLATNQNLPADPQSWWQWWNDHNEIYVDGQKQLQTVRRAQQVEVEDFIPASALAAMASASAASGSQDGKDCLAAGTAIWTTAGAIAVEELQVGDLVLAQDAETGELAFKPVMRTTIRPRTKLVHIHTGDKVIQASGGHPFWVAGEGWVKARNLKSGMELHRVDGTVTITAIELGDKEVETYNLVVADFNTYFAGESKVLSHDNTIRQSSNSIVPGLQVE